MGTTWIQRVWMFDDEGDNTSHNRDQKNRSSSHGKARVRTRPWVIKRSRESSKKERFKAINGYATRDTSTPIGSIMGANVSNSTTVTNMFKSTSPSQPNSRSNRVYSSPRYSPAKRNSVRVTSPGRERKWSTGVNCW